jgi:hypothetical protein
MVESDQGVLWNFQENKISASCGRLLVLEPRDPPDLNLCRSAPVQGDLARVLIAIGEVASRKLDSTTVIGHTAIR